MRRMGWLAALVIVAIGIAAYGYRSQLGALLQQSPVNFAALSGGTGVGGSAAEGSAANPAPSPPAAPAGGAGAGRSAPGVSGASAAHSAGAGARGGAGGGQPLFTVATAAATAGSLPDQRQTIGWILSSNATNLTTPAAGVVQQIAAMPGSDVKQGDVLVKLDARAANAAIARDKAALQRDQATFDQAQRTATAITALAQKGAETRATAQQATTAQAVAQATIAVDNAQLAADQLALDNTEIRAPFDGRIGAYQVAVGSLVQPAGQVVTLTAMSPVQVQFSVPENDLDQLRIAMANGAAKVTAVPPGSSGDAETGSISFLDSTVDRASGTVQVRGTLDNAGLRLWPGESVDVTLDLGARGGLVLVPTVAVVPATTGSVVYVVKSDGTIDVRNVTVAGANGDRTGIASGVQAGEHVVVEGQFNLVAGQRVAEAPPPTANAGGTAPAAAAAASRTEG